MKIKFVQDIYHKSKNKDDHVNKYVILKFIDTIFKKINTNNILKITSTLKNK